MSFVALPLAASACPYCARTAGESYIYATALMLLVPMGLVVGLGFWVRRVEQARSLPSE